MGKMPDEMRQQAIAKYGDMITSSLERQSKTAFPDSSIESTERGEWSLSHTTENGERVIDLAVRLADNGRRIIGFDCMELQAILFDFDYTLADSSRGVVRCVNDALHDLGLPPAVPDAICRTIGMSLTDTLVSLAGPERASQGPEFARRFKHHADQAMADLTVLYPAVDPVMRLLRRQGKKLGIVSTKFRYRIEGILQRDSLRDLFDVIVGGEDVAGHKPDPEGLRRAMADLHCSPPQVLYVGDSVIDAETAKRAGVSFVAVLSGVTSRSEFAGYPAIEIVENLSQLPERLAC